MVYLAYDQSTNTASHELSGMTNYHNGPQEITMDHNRPQRGYVAPERGYIAPEQGHNRP